MTHLPLFDPPTPIRSKDGRFCRPDQHEALQAARDRVKAQLIREAEAGEHARGLAYVHRHFRPLPGKSEVQAARRDVVEQVGFL